MTTSEQIPMAPPTAASDATNAADLSLGQRLWRRYAERPGVIARQMTPSLIQRINRFPVGPGAMLAQVQQRWAATRAAATDGGAALPYIVQAERSAPSGDNNGGTLPARLASDDQEHLVAQPAVAQPTTTTSAPATPSLRSQAVARAIDPPASGAASQPLPALPVVKARQAAVVQRSAADATPPVQPTNRAGPSMVDSAPRTLAANLGATTVRHHQQSDVGPPSPFAPLSTPAAGANTVMPTAAPAVAVVRTQRSKPNSLAAPTSVTPPAPSLTSGDQGGRTIVQRLSAGSTERVVQRMPVTPAVLPAPSPNPLAAPAPTLRTAGAVASPKTVAPADQGALGQALAESHNPLPLARTQTGGHSAATIMRAPALMAEGRPAMPTVAATTIAPPLTAPVPTMFTPPLPVVRPQVTVQRQASQRQAPPQETIQRQPSAAAAQGMRQSIPDLGQPGPLPLAALGEAAGFQSFADGPSQNGGPTMNSLPPTGRGAEAWPATLPLVTPSAAKVMTSRATTSSPAASAALPIARQPLAAESLSNGAVTTDAAAADPTRLTTPGASMAVSEPDVEQLTDQVSRRLARQLAVERERRGLGRWH